MNVVLTDAPRIKSSLKANEALALDSGAMVLSNAGYQTIKYHTDTR